MNGDRRGANDGNRVDAVTGSVIQGALENIAIEMGYKLMRMSYSSIIRESEDFGAALIDIHNRQMAEAKQSTPLQSGPIPGYIRGLRRQLAERGEEIRPGDVIMHNDAYAGASHGPDVAFVVPVFLEERLIGFTATTAHHLDIGAHTPGSGGIVDAIDSYAEGLQFQAVKVYEEGRRNTQSGTCCAATSASRTWCWATWRRRSPPRASARSATSISSTSTATRR